MEFINSLFVMTRTKEFDLQRCKMSQTNAMKRTNKFETKVYKNSSESRKF